MTYSNFDQRIRGAVCHLPEDRYQFLRALERKIARARKLRRKGQRATGIEKGQDPQL